MDQNAVHAEFHNFNWNEFDDFNQGIQEVLENYLESLREQDPSITSIPAAQRQQLVDQAKSFFYCSKTGNILNLDEYYAWARTNNAKIQELPDEVQIKEIDDASEPQSTPEDAPYSSNYQQLVELIVSGKPVPGIKDIPDTVLADQKSEASAPARKKPWDIQTKEPNAESQKSE